MEKLYSNLDLVYEEMVEIRRFLHQHPELSFEETETAAYIADYHTALGHEVRTNVGGNGVLAYLRGAKPGPTVALRADFDALPIHEQTDVPFKSKYDGVMHACGHDGHTATLLGLAKVLNGLQDELEGTIVFLHQHAEELPPGGAISMIEDGCLDGVDVIFGTHLQAQMPLGEIGYRTGALQAAPDRFDITIKGKGGHAAHPHDTKDSVVIGGQLINNLQQIVSRKVDPLDSAVVSVCNFVAENPYNVIADSAELVGTVRTFKEETREFIEKEMERIIKATCDVSGADYVYTYTRGYPTLVNHKEETEFVAEVAKEVPGVEAVKVTEPIMGGEDYAFYLQHVKGTFFFTGARNEDWDIAYPHHHPKFDIDERALLHAAKVLGAATLQYMNEYANKSLNEIG
ncbi:MULTISPECIES: M20 family metallopeptidase [Virgibacillus]|uniref:N-acyl-L-amino acid amidohydrolase n=2 Tax=Virgibacillus TaxID=84406 RepID=A0A024Q847_9BACI|nr:MULTISPECIES: M20 family metallopeptidase [Virgibacillus]EQB37757.1 amidohydrolase [Virgibacillus sp. CM-4]MYL40492.1 amidohydrolase [Virgibacillus massiliensis]GGJ58526.1 putative amidohydrolase YhaA [Virgibacillus kapii]CDQ38718.1 N-acyl-L-amino acid amidohydrolase [Virgibacillus massiliensis]